jgi:hypothetical protein
MTILKRFMMMVQHGNNDDLDFKPNESNEPDDDFNILKPPILFIKPREFEIKSLIEQYLQLKNIL